MESKPNKPSNLSFNETKRCSLWSHLSPRVVIYPLVVLAIAFFMNKHQSLTARAERNQQEAKRQQTVLDASKPASLNPVAAPAFPQLLFFHEKNLVKPEIVDQLREKYYKQCNVQPVDLTVNHAQKQKYADQKTPFAVFALPDGTTITVQAITSFDFFDQMLESMLKTYEAKCASSVPVKTNTEQKAAKP